MSLKWKDYKFEEDKILSKVKKGEKVTNEDLTKYLNIQGKMLRDIRQNTVKIMRELKIPLSEPKVQELYGKEAPKSETDAS